MSGMTAWRGTTGEGFDDLSVAELRRRGTNKWSYYGEDVLPAWVAEMDFALAPPIRAALHEAIERNATGYPPAAEASGLPAACAAWLARSFGLAVEPQQIRLVPDVVRGIQRAIEAFSRPASPVVIPTPAYPPFFEVVRAAGRAIVEVPMREEAGRAAIDLNAVDAALRAGAGTVLLCHPHNPLGRVFGPTELAALAAVVEAHGARVVVDELHAPLVLPGARHVPYASASAAAARHSATLVSASKGWNVPGLKCAQLVLHSEADLEAWDGLPYLRASHGVSILGMVANRAAYERGGPWLSRAVAYLDEGRGLLGELLAGLLPGVRYRAPEATYLAWLDCRALGLADPAAFFLERAKVALTDGAGFGEPGRGHVRLNFATSHALLRAIVRRMADALAGAGAHS
jgi:cystathionine beta-lyase